MYNKKKLCGPRVLMIGPSRSVRGGVSAVVNGYYTAGLQHTCLLKYIPTMRDGGKPLKMLVFAIAYLRFMLTVWRCDIVHVHVAAQNSFYRKRFFVRLAKRAGKKIVLHEHGGSFDHFFDQCSDSKKKKIRDTFAMADMVIALSEEWQNFYATQVCAPDKIRVIHNAVEVPPTIAVDYHAHSVLFMGKLCAQKGVYDLIETIPTVLEKVPDAQFYLCGDSEVNACTKAVAELGITSSVHFPGWVSGEEREEYAARCSVFVLPSYIEGMPMSLLEAMARGLAVISTNAGGIPQLIDNGENGFRIEAGDKFALASTLIRLLTDDTLKECFGQKARATVLQDYSLQSMPQQLMAVYNALFPSDYTLKRNLI